MNNPLDIGVAFREGWAAFAREAVALIVGFLLFGLVAGLSFGICAGPMTVGYQSMCIRAARGESVQIGDVFSGFSKFGPSFILMLLYGLAVGLGTLLCVIPGLAVAWFCVWATFLMADGDEDAMSCLKRSWEYSKQNMGGVIVMVIVASVVGSVGSAVGGVGGLVTMPLQMMMLAVAYNRAFGSGSGVFAEQPLPAV